MQHTQCITESEKYFGSHHVAKVGKDKNEVWMNRIRERLAAKTGLKPYITGLVTRILVYPNIPRKQLKFEVSFVRTAGCWNLFRGGGPETLMDVLIWTMVVV